VPVLTVLKLLGENDALKVIRPAARRPVARDLRAPVCCADVVTSVAYIKSQAHEGWSLIRTAYDDGGFSGASMDRPALQRLLADVQAGLVDVVVVYKVDRLTRSLADFAKLIELFDRHQVSFVSVTQAFNTTTSMGRLTLNVLLSFAQFEREVTSERIRDKIAASKRKGLWVGGMVPLGYESRDRKIVVVEEEAERVRLIFQRYRDLGSLDKLLRELRQGRVVTKVRRLANGRTIGGIAFTRGSPRLFAAQTPAMPPAAPHPTSVRRSARRSRKALPSFEAIPLASCV
jgi:DNA invertase Pin-like site-specific DNA recombinase